VTTGDGTYRVVEGLEINEFSRALIARSTAELLAERDSVRDLGLLP
jgi:malate dehydrogenase